MTNKLIRIIGFEFSLSFIDLQTIYSMKKNVTLIIVLLSFCVFNVEAQNKKKISKLIEKVSLKSVSGEGEEDDAQGRMNWERQRLADPATGKIPAFIHGKEMAFAATLPNDASSQQGRTTSSVNWNFRGPMNVGGRTRAFAIDVTNENIMLAGGVSGGMWRSIDGGLTWTRSSSLNAHPDVIAITQDKRSGHTNTWYYLSGEAYGTSSSGGGAFFLGNGMYKSIDGGLTWASLPSTVSGTPQSFDNIWDVAWNVVADSSNATQDVVYAATYGAIWKSSNGGTSWSIVKGATTNNAYFTDVAVSATGKVFASLSSDGATKGIYRSPDGITFTNILPTNFPASYDRQVIGIDPNNENIVYFFGPTPGTGKMSTDFLGDTLYNSLWKYEYLSGTGVGAGGIWTDQSQNLPGNINVFNGLNTQGGYDVVVKVKPGNSNIVFIGGTNVYRSTTAFSDSLNTTVIGGYAIGAALPFVEEYPGHHPDQHGLTFLPSNPNIMFSNCDGGLSKTLDNTATSVVWNELNNGYITSQFYTLAIDHSSTNDIVMGGLQDNGTYYTNTTNSQTSWVHSFDGDGSYCAISDGGANYYFSKQLGKVARTTVDPNGIVTAYRRIDPIGAFDYDFINPFVLDPNDNNVMYMPAGNKLWRNDDLSGIPLSNQWDSISTNWVTLPDTLLVGEKIVSVGISKIPAHRLYYGTNVRKIFKVDNANVGQPIAVQITSSSFPASANISCIAVDPSNADNVLVVISNYNVYSLFYSSNAGTSWIKVGGNLEQTTSGVGNGPSCRWASIIPVSNGVVYLVGTSTGLYATDTLIANATVWIQQGTNSIGNNVVDMIDYRSTDGLVVVGTHGNGVFSTHITNVNNITSVKDLSSSNFNFNLFPNPTSDKLNVKFSNYSSAKNLKLSIVNELGMLIKNISLSNLNIENFQIDVKDLAKGIYYLNVDDINSNFSKEFIKM